VSNFGFVVVLFWQFEPEANRANSITMHFDLGDVDPDSIAEIEHSTIEFRTTNNQNKIRHNMQNAVDEVHLFSHDLTSSKDAFTDRGALIADSSDRNRLAIAFKHAVILCGGKPSTF
jgi:hypothetical protein